MIPGLETLRWPIWPYFLSQLIPTNHHAWQVTVLLAERHHLTVYDAAYLELALRRGGSGGAFGIVRRLLYPERDHII